VAEDIARIFIAIELPVDVARGLDRTILLLRERVAAPDIKWVTAGNIHVTLKFLGDVPRARIEEIGRSLEPICAAAPLMRLSVAGLGAFPSPRAPRVVWAGLQGDIEPLSSLARSVDGALVALGYPGESRPFTPHLTLARVRQEATGDVRSRLADVLLRARMSQPLPFQADSASIMRSQLTPRGAVYSRLAHLPFGSSPDQ